MLGMVRVGVQMESTILWKLVLVDLSRGPTKLRAMRLPRPPRARLTQKYSGFCGN